MSRLATILAVLLCATAAHGQQLTEKKIGALAAEYFEADRARRAEILKELRPADRIDATAVEKWRKAFVKLMRKGRKLKRKGRDYFYDKKEKRGLYIVGGRAGRPAGLLIGLHGGGEGAGDAGSAAGPFSGVASNHGCIGIFPEVLEKTERGWTTSGTEEFVLELIEAAKRTWKIDTNRVYVVGHSMGGYGSWTIGAHHADLFAGLGPFAGAPTPITVDGSAYGEVIAIEDGVLPNLRNVALHIYQSLDDPRVPPAPNVFANKELVKLKKEYGGFNYKYVEVDGQGHGAPPGGYRKGVKWLYGFERETRPRRVLWQPVLSWKRMFYWLWWERPTPRVLVEARITAPNRIEIDLGGGTTQGFRVLLDEKLVDLQKEVAVVLDGREAFEGKVGYSLTTLLATAAERRDPELIFPASIDLSGAAED